MVMRQRVWIDGHVQGVLVGRVILYWSGLLIYAGLSAGCYQWWQNPEWTLGQQIWGLLDQAWLYLPTLMLLLPLVIFDIVRLSNRFAGPIYRLRMHLAELKQNSATHPLNFRDDDYWQQLADPINELQQRLLTYEQKLEAMVLVNKSLMQSGSVGGVSSAAELVTEQAHVTSADPPDSTPYGPPLDEEATSEVEPFVTVGV